MWWEFAALHAKSWCFTSHWGDFFMGLTQKHSRGTVDLANTLLFPEGLLGWGGCIVEQHKCIFITMSDIPVPYSFLCSLAHLWWREEASFSSNVWGFLILVGCRKLLMKDVMQIFKNRVSISVMLGSTNVIVLLDCKWLFKISRAILMKFLLWTPGILHCLIYCCSGKPFFF